MSEKTKPMRQRITARPFVYVNVATTADGKIAPASRRYLPFSSRRDQQLLLQLRAGADAVMAGARTVDSFPVNMGPGPKKFRDLRRRRGLAEYNLRVIVSGSGSIDPHAEIFKHRFSPIIILTTRRAGRKKLQQLRARADEVKICGATKIDFALALRWLREKWKVKRLLCEGGGELNAALFCAGLVDEVYLTLCPLLLGGRTAPTLADGTGAKKIADAVKLELKSMKRADGELFLVYRVRA